MTDGGIHSFPMRASLEDTDSGVVVCFANYLKCGAGARTECLRVLGIENSLEAGLTTVKRYAQALVRIELKLGRMTPKHVRA